MKHGEHLVLYLWLIIGSCRSLRMQGICQQCVEQNVLGTFWLKWHQGCWEIDWTKKSHQVLQTFIGDAPWLIPWHLPCQQRRHLPTQLRLKTPRRFLRRPEPDAEMVDSAPQWLVENDAWSYTPTPKFRRQQLLCLTLLPRKRPLDLPLCRGFTRTCRSPELARREHGPTDGHWAGRDPIHDKGTPPPRSHTWPIQFRLIPFLLESVSDAEPLPPEQVPKALSLVLPGRAWFRPDTRHHPDQEGRILRWMSRIQHGSTYRPQRHLGTLNSR